MQRFCSVRGRWKDVRPFWRRSPNLPPRNAAMAPTKRERMDGTTVVASVEMPEFCRESALLASVDVATRDTWRARRKRERESDGRRGDEKKLDGAGEVYKGAVSSDPLLVLGEDMFTVILHRLDGRSVARSLLVSRGWSRVACRDDIWGPKLEELWVGKAHIPQMAMMRGLSRLDAYSISLLDGKRSRITKDDLCDHVWEFHFKKIAPQYWLNLDPSWKGTGPPLRRYFNPDGSQTSDPADPIWGGHECTYSIVTSFVGDGKIREHYVRINRWPRMAVSRRHDWSWELDNHLYNYASIPDAHKVGGTGPLFPVW